MTVPVMGYSLIARLTPVNGEPSEINFGGLQVGALRWSHAPDRVQVSYELVRRDRETVNYRKRPLFLGWRRHVSITLSVSGDNDELANDHGMIVALVNAGTDPEVTVSLSLDGGQTFFDVSLARYRGPDGFGGKLLAGARYTIEFDGTDLISELPKLTDITVDSVPAAW